MALFYEGTRTGLQYGDRAVYNKSEKTVVLVRRGTVLVNEEGVSKHHLSSPADIKLLADVSGLEAEEIPHPSHLPETLFIFRKLVIPKKRRS